jgi:GNAT superfamily N-acetyltransferase
LRIVALANAVEGEGPDSGPRAAVTCSRIDADQRQHGEPSTSAHEATRRMGLTHVPNFSIARATVADSDAILACLRAAFEPYRAEYTADAYEDTVMDPKTVRQRIERMTLFVARNDADEIIGTIGGASRGAEGHIRGMAVLPSAQGTGVADRLLQAIERYLAEAGCSFVTLDTTAPLTRAVRFYERHGYARSGVISDFFGMPLYEYRKQLLPM